MYLCFMLESVGIPQALTSMTTRSRAPIEKCLRDYSVDIETWSPRMAETHMTLGSRQDLHAQRAQMSDLQRAELARVDALAVAAYASVRDGEDPYDDIRALGEIVAIIEAERINATA